MGLYSGEDIFAGGAWTECQNRLVTLPFLRCQVFVCVQGGCRTRATSRGTPPAEVWWLAGAPARVPELAGARATATHPER